MKTKALILGGGVWQLDIIEKAKLMGFHVIVADISSSSPGKDIADEFICIDTNDKEGLLKYAKEKGVKIVIGEQTDRVVPIAAYLNEQLSLSAGIKPEIAKRFTDKFLMHEVLKENGIRVHEYQKISTVREAKLFGEKHGYPLIIKPISSQSSLGVFKIDSPEQIEGYLAHTMKYSVGGNILIEQFVGGTELTVEGISVAGIAYPLAISEKEHFKYNECVAKRIIYPPAYNNAQIVQVSDYIKVVVEALGLINGIFHAELKYFNGEAFLLEVAARGGGHKIASVIAPFVSGVDIYECFLKTLNKENVSIQSGINKSAMLGFFDLKPGRVKNIMGLEEIEQHKSVYEVKLRFKVGDEIKEASDDTNRLGYYILKGNTRNEVMELDRFVNSTLQIEYF
jgi:biotin carboxylase